MMENLRRENIELDLHEIIRADPEVMIISTCPPIFNTYSPLFPVFGDRSTRTSYYLYNLHFHVP